MNREAELSSVYTFESQARQYPEQGAPGISYFAGDMSEHYGPDFPPVDCLLYRDGAGFVRGILNHYPVNYPNLYLPPVLRLLNPFIEEAGAVNIWVAPQWQRRGIATKLVREALRRWPGIDPERQRYTDAGLAFINTFIERSQS